MASQRLPKATEVYYLSIRYTERLAQVGSQPSVGSVGDSFDNALAETVIGLFKTEVIHRRGPWCNLEAFEYATLESNVLLVQGQLPMAAGLKTGALRESRGAVQIDSEADGNIRASFVKGELVHESAKTYPSCCVDDVVLRRQNRIRGRALVGRFVRAAERRAPCSCHHE